MPGDSQRTLAARRKRFTTEQAKQKVAEAIAAGAKREDAMRSVGRSVETYRDWMKKDPEFHALIDQMRAFREDAAETGRQPVPPFPEFCEKWLKQPLAKHHRMMWDAIEGREPEGLVAPMRYWPGSDDWEPKLPGLPAGRVIVNLPPGHGKTTAISINYVTWLIHRDPNIKIIVVCKDRDLAEQIVGGVKFRLTSAVFAEMHTRFAPEGGWKDTEQSWTAHRIYVQGKNDGEKDPTLQALGIGSRIYGARSDVIILDDSVTLSNVNEHAKQRRWLEQEVETRLDGGGLLAVLGTRVAPVDLYSELREVEDFEGKRAYTYLSMPAVLDEGDGAPEHWEVLWPEFMGPKKLVRIRKGEDTWALVYQQQDVAEDATFNAHAVDASINRNRVPGPMTEAGIGHREGGMRGLYVVGGLDPATVGATAMQVWGLDREKQKRYVLDGFNQANCSPQTMRERIYYFTETYGINEWVIERNAFQRFLTQDMELNQFLHAHGCKLTEHFTNAEKYDSDFGIQSMAQLFLTCGRPHENKPQGGWIRTPETALIELPNPRQNGWMSEFINQLVVWQPSGLKRSDKTDLVMAAWFCEIACKRMLGYGQRKQTHVDNPWLSKSRLSQRRVIDLNELREQRQREQAV